MAKTFTDWPDKAKHSISYAQHKKNLGGTTPAKPSAKPVDAARVAARAAKDPAFLARARKDPGLRSKLPDNLLSASDRAERVLQARLNNPIVAGSNVTGRDLAHQAAAASTVQYGPQETELASQLGGAQRHLTDVGGWYDQYQAQIADASRRIGEAQAGAVQGTAAMSGVGAQQAGQLAGQAAAQAAPGTTVAADIAQSAGQGTAARENLVSSYLGQAQQQAATQKTLGDWMTGVVAPGQKIQALNTAQQGIQKLLDRKQALAAEKGAFNQKTRADIRQQEVANVVALGQLGNQTLAAKTSAAEKTPAAAAAKTAATEEAKMAAKYGKTTHQWRLLGPKGRAQLIAKSDKTQTEPGSDVITSGALAGKTKTWVAAHPDEAGKLVDAYNKKPGKTSKTSKGAGGKGPDWAAPGQMSSAAANAATLKGLAIKAKTGQLWIPPKGGQKKPGVKRDRHATGVKIRENYPSVDPAILTAVLDAAYDGHLSANTVKGLIAANFKPSRIASALGVPTSGQLPKGTTTLVHPKKPATYGSRQDTGR